MAFASHKVALLPKIPYSGDAYPLFGKGDNFFYNTPPLEVLSYQIFL